MPGRIVCFVCGNPGAETSIHVRQQETGPYFPFLEHHDPPKGSRQPALDGSIDCCRVCYAFLTTQWELYERSKTPAIKRLYWLKRADNGNFTGAEMRLQGEYIAQVMGLQYQPGCFDLDSALSPENSTLDSNYHSRPLANSSQHFSQQSTTDKMETLSTKPFIDSALDLSTPKKEMEHVKNSSAAESNKMPDPTNFICYTCGQQHALSYGCYIDVLQQNSNEPFFPILENIKPYPGSDRITRSGQVRTCGHCKNILFQQWQAYEMSGTPITLRTYKIPTKLFKGSQSESKNVCKKTDNRDDVDECFVCYICGVSNRVENAGLLNTLPAKSPSSVVMFFPFIRELQRPPGAEPLRPDGSVFACAKCYGSLSYQWQVQEMDGVPLYHRNYSLHFLSVKQTSQEADKSSKSSDAEPVKPLNIQISMASPLQKSQGPVSSVFPTTQGLLAIAPVLDSMNSRPVPCESGESLSNSPVKFHDALLNCKTSVSDSGIGAGSMKTVPHPLQQVSVMPKKVCYLCGERCLINKMHYLSSYPVRHEAKHTNAQAEPFFPFLANCEPAPKADPVTEEGCVIACNICYHTLMKQWSEFEQSNNPADSNRWLRKYTMPNYSCYVCAAVCERKLLRSLATEKFHFLKEHNAPADALVMNDGDRVAVCKPCAYSLMQQYAEFERMGLPSELRKYNWIQKAPVMYDSAPEDESQDEHRFEKYARPPYQQQSSSSGGDKDPKATDQTTSTESGGPAGSKPPSLSMMSPAGAKLQRNTATVSPLDHVTSPTNGVTSVGASAALNASRTSSFAAALRKLANQAKDAPDEAPKTSTANSPREATTKAGPPPLVYTSTPLTTPPVVTIAPTQAHPSLLSSDVRPPLERLHSSHSTSSLFDSAHAKSERDRPQSSASRDEERASRDSHSQSARRVTPHSTPGATSPLSGREETARGFQPYRPGDDMRPSLPSSLSLEQAAAAAAYSYPSFLPPHAFPHPAFRFDDPLLLERYRMMQHPYLPYGPPGMLPHPSLHPLMAAGGRYPPELLHPHLAFNSPAGRLPEHRSPSLHPDRQRLEDEKREIEREREKERERERERDMALYRERQRALERESEKQRERDRSSHREREERKESGEKPRSDSTAGKTEESLSAKFGSIIQGTPKGLGIADRYPRAPSSSHSASLTLGKREERRSSKDENSSSFLNNSFNRLPSHKSSNKDDHQKTSEPDKRYSLVAPLSSSERTGPPPLISPKSGELKPNKSEGSLFRPFDSKYLSNGYDSQYQERDKLIHHRPEEEEKKYDSERGLNLGHWSHDQKSNVLPGGEKSLYLSKFGSSTSAFHSLDSRVSSANMSKHNTESSNVQSTHSICSPLHHLGQKESHPLTTLHNSQTPLNVPAYSAKSLVSSSSFLPESQTCISKLDLEEKKLNESRSNGSYCSDSDCDMNSDDNEEVKNLLISSGPPLQLDTNRKKMKLLKELGLTTHRHKKDKQFELFRVRRRKMHERSVSPMNVEESREELSPMKCTYSPEELCREPDYKRKCQFFSHFLKLQPVPTTTRIVNEIIYTAIAEDRKRRLVKRNLHLNSSDQEDSNSDQPDVEEENKDNISRDNSDSVTSLSQFKSEVSQSDINRHNISNFSTASLSHLSDLTSSLLRQSGNALKSEPSEISNSKQKLSKNFAEEFHKSVLQTTRQKELAHRSGETSIQGHHTRPEGQSSRTFSHQHSLDQWPGLDVVMETYQKHNIDGRHEQQILMNRARTLQAENKELSKAAQTFSKRMEELLRNKQQLEEERMYRQSRIDSLKSAIKNLK